MWKKYLGQDYTTLPAGLCNQEYIVIHKIMKIHSEQWFSASLTLLLRTEFLPLFLLMPNFPKLEVIHVDLRILVNK